MNSNNVTTLATNNMISTDRALTAMCIWEILQEKRATSSVPAAVEVLWSDIGASEMREYTLEVLAPLADRAFDSYVELAGYDLCFDWEFIPKFIELIGHYLAHYGIENIEADSGDLASTIGREIASNSIIDKDNKSTCTL